MPKLLRILNIFFVVLGAFFLLLIIALAYLFIADPLNIRPLIDSMRYTPEETAPPPPTTTESEPLAPSNAKEETSSASPPPAAPQPVPPQEDPNPLLSPEQEATLRSFGIDPAKLPSEITPDMETCFTGILGAERVAEIKAGKDPTIVEFLQARSCFE
jgi:pyruvate/2-oxoglutarate dehydrogenase complex dihydrolipoamide acyltransferase (E2) component